MLVLIWYCKSCNKSMTKVLHTLAKMQERQDKLEGRQDKSEEVAMFRKDLEEIDRDVWMVG